MPKDKNEDLLVATEFHQDLKDKSELNFKVTQSNSLVQLQYSEFALTAQEKDLVSFVLSRIKPNSNKIHPVSFAIKDYLNFVGLTDGSKNYAAVRESAKHIRDTSIWLKTSKSDNWFTFSWFDKVVSTKNDSELTIYVSKDLEPFLLNLSKNFNQYQLRIMLSLNGSYPKKLYELLNSYAYQGFVTIGVDELKEYLSIPNTKSYERFNNIKNRIIEPSINQINDVSNIAVSVEYLKTDKKVTAFRFNISVKELEKSITASEKANYDFYFNKAVTNGFDDEIVKSSYFVKVLRTLCGWDHYKNSLSDPFTLEVYSALISALSKMLTLNKPMRYQGISCTSADIMELVNTRISLGRMQASGKKDYLSPILFSTIEKYRSHLEKREDIKNHNYYLRSILYNTLAEDTFVKSNHVIDPAASYRESIYEKCPELKEFIIFYYSDKQDKDEYHMKQDIRKCKEALRNAGYDESILFAVFLQGETDL